MSVINHPTSSINLINQRWFRQSDHKYRLLSSLKNFRNERDARSSDLLFVFPLYRRRLLVNKKYAPFRQRFFELSRCSTRKDRVILSTESKPCNKNGINRESNLLDWLEGKRINRQIHRNGPVK